MHLYLNNLEQIRSVQWSQKFRWDVMFEDSPSEFFGWFPATDVKENVWSLEHYTFTGGQSSYSLPKNSTEFDLSITYVDDISLSVEAWITKWVNSTVLNDGNGISSIHESSKIVYLVKFDNKGKIIYRATYKVIPSGSMYFEGASTAERHIETIDLKIVKTIEIKHG